MKRLLSFLLVMAMVFSFLPVMNVTAEDASPDVVVKLERTNLHNAETGLQYTVALASKLTEDISVGSYTIQFTLAEGATAAFSNAEIFGANTIAEAYDAESAAQLFTLAAGEVKELGVLTVSEALAAEDIFFEITAPTADGEPAVYVPAVELLGYTCEGHDVGNWIPLTNEDVSKLKGGVLPSGNYYLVEPITAKATTVIMDGQNVNICMNGQTWTCSARLLDLKGAGSNVNICDCTATGTGVDLVSGKLIFGSINWGNLRISGPDNTLNVYDVILETTEDVVTSSTNNGNIGNAATFYAGSDAVNSRIYAENVLVRNIKSGKTVVDCRSAMYLKDVTFQNCSGGVAVVAVNGAVVGSGDFGITLDSCQFVGCEGYAVNTNRAVTSTGKAVVILKGDLQSTSEVYVDDNRKIYLDLGENADVTIRTQSTKTEANIGNNLVMVEGATLTAGTVTYANKGIYLAYENGAYKLLTHSHDDVEFKVWDNPNKLPTSGSYYLVTDVETTTTYTVSSTLNLDLNGHNITSVGDHKRIYTVEGTLNLYDCKDGYDAAGNWIGGTISGVLQDFGAICVSRGGAGKTTRPTFNMYGGRIADNGNITASSSGGAVYVSSSLNKNGADQIGGQFVMYGGELYNNHVGALGGAITLKGWGPTDDSKPATREGWGAKFVMYGGKIWNNVVAKNGSRSGDGGAIYANNDAEIYIYGGEFEGNSATTGGAICLGGGGVGKLVIENATFKNNNAANGGAVNISTPSSAIVQKCVFEENTGSTVGGALRQIGAGVGTLEVSECTFKSNSSRRGGAIYLDNPASATVDKCVFQSNSAADNADKSSSNYGSGGAIGMTGAEETPWNVTISNSTFKGNTAYRKNAGSDYSGMGGAVISLGHVHAVIDNCEITGNSSNRQGGAIVCRDNGGSMVVKNSTITGNSSTGFVGGAIYVLNGQTLTLDNTVITGNSNTNHDSGAVYITSTTSRLILSGATVVADNTSKTTKNVQDIYFQTQSSRTNLLEVNELSDGAHVNVYFAAKNNTSTVITNNVASGFVRLMDTTDGVSGTQSSWNCGWITVYTSATDEGRNVSRVNDEFVFGHWHEIDGKPVEFQAYTETTAPTAAGYYYMSKDITTSAQWNITVDGIHFCFNGKTLTCGKSSSSTIMLGDGTISGITLDIYDCTAIVNADGKYVGGGITGTKKNFGSGVYVNYAPTTPHVLNWHSGAIFNCISNTTSASGGSGGAALYVRAKSGTNLAGIVNWSSGAIFGSQTNLTVYYSGTKLTTGGSASGVIANNGTMTLENCLIYDNYAADLRDGKVATNGGAVYNTGTLTLKNCVFSGNHDERKGGAICSAGGTITTENCVFEGNYSENGTGGAIYIDNGSLTIDENTVFTGNYAADGGAIYATNNSTTKTATVTVNGGLFEGNHATRGGAIYNNCKKLTINGGLFEGNYVENGLGGAILNDSSDAALTIAGTADKMVVFRGNYTTTAGEGAVEDCRGGAINLANGESVSISYAEFDSNDSVYRGGAILADDGTDTLTALIENCVFKNNTADNRGGAIFGANNSSGTSSLTIKKSTFENNSTKESAGAICAANKITLAVEDCEFTGNSAQYGGAYYSSNTSVNVSFADCVFKNNTATADAGALYPKFYKTFTVDGCTFENNTANDKGGALFISAANISNLNVTVTDCTFTGNSATSGGAVYVFSDRQLTAAKPLQNHTATLDGCTITGNTAVTYAAVGVGGDTVATLKDCVIQNNTAENYGAVGQTTATSTLVLSGATVITGNAPADLGLTITTSEVMINASGLTEGAKIGAYMTADRYAANPVFTTGGANLEYFFENDSDELLLATTVVGELTELMMTKYVAEDGSGFTTMQDAVEQIIDDAQAAGETPVINFQTNVTEKLVVPEGVTNLFVDLEGKNITEIEVPAGATIEIIDSITNDYNSHEVKGSVTITGEGSVVPFVTVTNKEGKVTGRYAVIKDEETGLVSAHKIYLAINGKVLRTARAGIGFNVIYAGDDFYKANLEEFGMELALDENFQIMYNGGFASEEFVSGLQSGEKTPNQKRFVLHNILAEDASDNQARYEQTIYARPYVVVNGQTYYGAVVQTSMEEMVNAALASGDETAIGNVNDMLEKYDIK